MWGYSPHSGIHYINILLPLRYYFIIYSVPDISSEFESAYELSNIILPPYRFYYQRVDQCYQTGRGKQNRVIYCCRKNPEN